MGNNEIFRSTVFEVCGIKFWKVLPNTKETGAFCARKVKKVDEDIKNENDIIEYMNKISGIPMPKDDLQWDFHIHDNYQGDKILLFGRVHHGASDGMGTMMLLSSIDGNKNLSAIPSMKDISVLKKFILFSLSPIFFIHSLWIDLFVKNDESPYTLNNGFSGKKCLKVSTTYEFEELR